MKEDIIIYPYVCYVHTLFKMNKIINTLFSILSLRNRELRNIN